MKNPISGSIAVLAFAILLACSSKKEDAATNDGNEWKQMDEFHMVMAETFHPYKDSANLEPIKTKAGQLASSAETWATSELPSKVDNDEMKQKLQELKTETQTLKDMVAAGTDDAIGQQLTKVHDLFHAIQESWYGGHGDHH
jgi:hypothetical protein